ncbi:hypothetical protein MKL29_06180 [Streptococcus suis]|nr:hypothetical protein [Streptococcus suis]
MMLSQKQLKSLKKEVNEESALGVGFLVGIEKAIPDYALYEAIRQLANEGDLSTLRDAELQNRLVTTAIEYMNYQDFKAVAPYLFSYRRADLAKDTLLKATPLPATPSVFDAVKGRGERLFEELETPDALDELLLTNGLTLLAINPKTNELLLVDSQPDMDRVMAEQSLSSQEQSLVEDSDVATYYIIPLEDLSLEPLADVMTKAAITLFDAQYLELSDEGLLEALDYDYDLEDFELLEDCYDELAQLLKQEQSRTLEQEREL